MLIEEYKPHFYALQCEASHFNDQQHEIEIVLKYKSMNVRKSLIFSESVYSITRIPFTEYFKDIPGKL